MVTTAMAGVHLIRRAHRARVRCRGRRSAALPGVAPGRTRGPRPGDERPAAARGTARAPFAGRHGGRIPDGTRTREVTSQSRCVSIAEDGDGPPIPLRAAVVHMRGGPSTVQARGFRRPSSGAHREGMDGRRTARPRDAVGGSTHGGRRSGWRPGWCGQPPSSSPSVRARTSPGAAGAPAVLVAAAMSTGRSTWPVPPGRSGTATGYMWPVESSPGAAPVVEVPFREPTHRFGPGHRGVDLTAPVGAAVLGAAAGRRRARARDRARVGAPADGNVRATDPGRPPWHVSTRSQDRPGGHRAFRAACLHGVRGEGTDPLLRMHSATSGCYRCPRGRVPSQRAASTRQARSRATSRPCS
jgi:hypothetical protein